MFRQQLINSIYKADLFSKPVKIKIGGDDASRSFVGVIFSTFIIVIIILLTKTQIENFLFGKNPKVTGYIEYDTKVLNLTSKNFGISISFFSQLMNEKAEISNVTNNYTDLIRISDINMICNTCNFSINDTYYKRIYAGNNTGKPSRKFSRNLQNSENLGWDKKRAFLDRKLLPDFSKRIFPQRIFQWNFVDHRDLMV